MKLDFGKIIELFNNLNEQIRYSIFGAVVLLIVLLDVFFLVLPQLGAIVDTNQQISKLTDDTQQVLTDRQRLGQLKKNLEASRLQLKTLSDKVRPIQEVPILLGIISNIANECNVKIDQLVPDKLHQTALKSSPDGKYYALPVVIKARCGYHMFGRFLNKLENENMFFVVQDFIIQNADKDVGVHSFSLTIKMIIVERSSNTSKGL